MINFECDYTEGAHPEILKALSGINFDQNIGYGEDKWCRGAADIIRETSCCPDAQVFFLTGGTQINRIALGWLLRPGEGVISAETGHIGQHEAGAIEALGHKVLCLPSSDGKITAGQIKTLCRSWREDPNRSHMVRPGAVYISQPTENGTLYSRPELESISAVCRENGIRLYADGARLAYALGSPYNDVSLADLAAACDALCIGGTKAGALFGEALLIRNVTDREALFGYIKLNGALLAKGWLLGIQFYTMLKDGLYIRAAEAAVEKALRIRKAFEKKGIGMRYDSPTNQQFPVLPDPWLKSLDKNYLSSFWYKPDAEHTVVRFCTSWATGDSAVEKLIKDINAL